MNKIANELRRIANSLLPRVLMVVPRPEGVESHVYNGVHNEVQKFLDRVRRNEAMETILLRHDTQGDMRLEVGFDSHDAGNAIVREIVKLTSRLCARNGIDTIQVVLKEGSDSEAAKDILDMAGAVETQAG